jgi:hypothetical protein
VENALRTGASVRIEDVEDVALNSDGTVAHFGRE